MKRVMYGWIESCDKTNGIYLFSGIYYIRLTKKKDDCFDNPIRVKVTVETIKKEK